MAWHPPLSWANWILYNLLYCVSAWGLSYHFHRGSWRLGCCRSIDALCYVRALTLPCKHPIAIDFDNNQPYFDQHFMFMDFSNLPFLVSSSGTLEHIPLREFPSQSWYLESPKVWLDLYWLCPKSKPTLLLKAIATGYIAWNYSQSLNSYTDGSETPHDIATAASHMVIFPWPICIYVYRTVVLITNLVKRGR